MELANTGKMLLIGRGVIAFAQQVGFLSGKTRVIGHKPFVGHGNLGRPPKKLV